MKEEKLDPKLRSQKLKKLRYTYWRFWTRKLAYIDMITLSMALSLGTLVLNWRLTGQNMFPCRIPEVQQDERLAEDMTMALFFVLTLVGLWGSIHLIESTDQGRDAKESLEMVRYWRISKIGYILFSFFGIVGTEPIVIALIVLWHLLFLLSGYQYIYALELLVADIDLEGEKVAEQKVEPAVDSVIPVVIKAGEEAKSAFPTKLTV